MVTKPLIMSWHTARINFSAEGNATWDCGHYDTLDAKVERQFDPVSAVPSGYAISEQWQNKFFGLYAKFLIVRTLDQGALNNISDFRDYTSAIWQLPPQTEFLQASWKFCEQVYSNVSVDLGVLHVGSVIENPLNLVSWEDMFQDTDSNSNSSIFHSNATGVNYTVGTFDGEWATGILSELFSAHLGATPVFGRPYPSPTYDISDSDIIDCSGPNKMINFAGPGLSTPSELMKSFSFYLKSADIRGLTNNVATALTARIRNADMRGNSNLTMFPGNAFVNETFITVQWPWMILPVMEIVLAAATLAVTIVLTRQQALLKGSTLPLLMQRMDGWSSEETNVRRLDTKEQLRERVKKMVARLDEGQDGELIFKRQC